MRSSALFQPNHVSFGFDCHSEVISYDSKLLRSRNSINFHKLDTSPFDKYAYKSWGPHFIIKVKIILKTTIAVKLNLLVSSHFKNVDEPKLDSINSSLWFPILLNFLFKSVYFHDTAIVFCSGVHQNYIAESSPKCNNDHTDEN